MASNTAEPLKSWLNRPNPVDSLKLAIKAWNSVEFTSPNKYDIIVLHFAELLAANNVDDVVFLKTVNEFVSLDYPIGALSVVSKRHLVNSLVTLNVSKTSEYFDVLRSLQLHPRMANFYNSTPHMFGELISRLFDQELILLKANPCGSQSELLKLHLNDVRLFCQYNTSTDGLGKIFAAHFMPALVRIVIQSQYLGFSVEKESFAILNLIYLSVDKGQNVKSFLKNYPNVDLDYFKLFPSIHELLVFLDALLATYHNDKEMIDMLLNCVFEKLPSDFNLNQILIWRHVLYLLRKYDVSLTHYQVHTSRISSLIMNIVAKKSQAHPVEVLDMICQAVQWNPVIIHDEVLVVIVHFMTVQKEPKTVQKFAELQRKMMTSRLNRLEKRTGKLLELVKGEIDSLIMGPVCVSKRKMTEATPPSKKKKKLNSTEITEVASEIGNQFLVLLETCYSTDTIEEPAWDDIWSCLSNIWPKSVSQMWGQSVSTLVSKTSLVIWKSLLINLKDSLEIATGRSHDPQSVLYTKFVCCFLVEYLASSRLLEHTDQKYATIEGMCEQTKEALKQFGKQILETEHNSDMMGAFLSVVIKYSTFKTSLLCYRPDSIDSSKNQVVSQNDDTSTAQSIYDFLSSNEWSSIEQRVVNFGDERCRAMFLDLGYRRSRSSAIAEHQVPCSVTKICDKAFIQDYKVWTKFNSNCVYFDEFVRELTRVEKITLAKTILEPREDTPEQPKLAYAKQIGEQYELVEISALVLLFLISEKHLPKGALLRAVDIAELMQQSDGEITLPDFEQLDAQKPNKEIKDYEGLLSHIHLLKVLPLGYLREREKELFYTLLVCLCYDLKGHSDAQDLVLSQIRLIRELGFRFDGLKYLTLGHQLQMMHTRAGRIMVLDTVANYFGDAQMEQIKAILKKIAKDEEEHVDLTLLMAERFSAAKKNHRNEKAIAVYKQKLSKLVFHVYERDMECKQGPAGLVYALNMYLSNKDNLVETNAALGQLCLRVGNSNLMQGDEMDEEQKAKIIGYCFQHMAHLSIDVQQLAISLDVIWSALRETKEIDMMTSKSKTDLMSLFNVHATTEKYIEILQEILDVATNDSSVEKMRVTCKWLQILCKSAVNQAKGTVLSEFVKKTLDVLIMKFTLTAENVYEHPELILDILRCFSVATQNRQIVMSQSLFANILAFCLDINLKRFKVNEANAGIFEKLHQQLTQLCTNLIQARSLALKNAMPQFVSLMKDLVHTICAFRNERSDLKQKLTDDEVKMLSTLALRLEPILNGFADRDHLGRKVAPYLLVYVINEMIFNPNSTTLYPGVRSQFYPPLFRLNLLFLFQVKLAIHNVCYKLIAICDVKYSQFILRGCSEASRDVYKTLVKEYEQYYKFQGKV